MNISTLNPPNKKKQMKKLKEKEKKERKKTNEKEKKKGKENEWTHPFADNASRHLLYSFFVVTRDEECRPRPKEPVGEHSQL